MLRRVRESWLQVAIASGVLSRKFVRSPLVRLRKSPARRQKLAEVLQLSQQVVFPRSVRTHAHVSFANPVKGMELDSTEVMPAVAKIGRELLADHLSFWGISPGCVSPIPKVR
jgi:hypothetical protein